MEFFLCFHEFYKMAENDGEKNRFAFFLKFVINAHTPVAQEVADEVIFRRFQGE